MITPEMQQQISDLRQQGMDQYQIAQRLCLPLDEVQQAIFSQVDADAIEFLHWAQHY